MKGSIRGERVLFEAFTLIIFSLFISRSSCDGNFLEIHSPPWGRHLCICFSYGGCNIKRYAEGVTRKLAKN